METVRVLIADHSQTARVLLREILEPDRDLVVVAEAATGGEAVEMARRLEPSVVLMDIEMSGIDGFEATKRIMVERPTPIIVVSGRFESHAVERALQAVRAGALTVIPNPSMVRGTAAYAAQASRLVMVVKALADVKVVRQRERRASASTHCLRSTEAVPIPARLEALGVAASTGGPAAVYRFLQSLPPTLDIPILLVQHIAHGFTGGLTSWLAGATALPVSIAGHGERLAGGHVYLAPDHRHLRVSGRRASLSADPPIEGFRPAANALFCSMADAYGPNCAGVVLSGMGHDGFDGAARLRAVGAVVLAQDAGTSVVYGMPGAVVNAGLANFVGPVEELAERIAEIVVPKVLAQ